MKEWVAYEGDSCTPEREEAKRADLANFSIDAITRRTERMAEENKKLYPEGRQTGGEGDDDEPTPSHVDPD